MAAPDRTIRQLRLRAPAEADVRRAARQLEDALRCASLPDGGGRLLLVRRLALGRLAADITPQGLALLLERCMQECGYSWVHGAEPRAASANAVWFRETSEALVFLAVRVAAGTAPAAWFWQRVLPGYRSDGSRAQLLEAILHQALTLPERSAAVVALTSALLETVSVPALQMLLTAAARGTLAAVAQRMGSPTARTPPEPGSSAPRSWHSPHGTLRALNAAQQRDLPWLPWLLAAAGWYEVPASQRWLRQSWVLQAPAAHGPFAVNAVRRVADDTAPQGDAASLIAISQAAPCADVPITTLATAAPGAHRSAATHTPARCPSAPRSPVSRQACEPGTATGMLHVAPRLDSCHASAGAGILFLLPLLLRLGFASWSATLAPLQARAIAMGVLRQALQRLHLEREDPAWNLLEGWPMSAEPAERIEAPPIWSDPRIAITAPASGDCEQLAATWLIACRRSLRRAARIGLASLVLRPGGLSWSLTHLDAYFDLQDSDLRVRRNGLDIDPGWQAWLGRVVSFHYRRGLWQ